MYKQAKDHSTAVCQLLARKNATAECKKLCIELSVHKKIIYYAKYMNSSLEQFRKLDTPFNSLIRHITKNTRSYSNTMLYTPDKFGGIGFKRLSDEIQSNKWSYLQRQFIKQQDSETMGGILTREARLRGDPVIPSSAITINKGHRTKGWWISSLMEWFDEVGLTLRTPGIDTSHSDNESLIAYHLRLGRVMPESEIDNFARVGISTVGDLSDTEEYPYDNTKVSAALRIGQCWLVRSTENWAIVEILSFEGPDFLQNV
jgi:hypothetical protein